MTTMLPILFGVVLGGGAFFLFYWIMSRRRDDSQKNIDEAIHQEFYDILKQKKERLDRALEKLKVVKQQSAGV